MEIVPSHRQNIEQHLQQYYSDTIPKSSFLWWYWLLKGIIMSKWHKIPPTFAPKNSDDFLEQLAWSSIVFDQLGGPSSQHIILSTVIRNPKDNSIILSNPNKTWDMHISAAPVMKQVQKLQHILDYVTVILHIAVLLPLTSSYFSNQNRDYKRWIETLQKQYNIKR